MRLREKLLCLPIVNWSVTRDRISVLGFLWNLLYYAECDSVIVNYLCWKCLFDREISSANKFFIIKWTPHWLSTAWTPKIGTILCFKWGWMYEISQDCPDVFFFFKLIMCFPKNLLLLVLSFSEQNFFGNNQNFACLFSAG